MEEENNSEEIIHFQYSNVLYFVQQVEDPLSVCLRKSACVVQKLSMTFVKPIQ